MKKPKRHSRLDKIQRKLRAGLPMPKGDPFRDVVRDVVREANEQMLTPDERFPQKGDDELED